MSGQRWLVLAVELAEQHPDETIWRVRLRAPATMQPTYLLHVSQNSARAAPYHVGGAAEVDARLLDAEE